MDAQLKALRMKYRTKATPAPYPRPRTGRVGASPKDVSRPANAGLHFEPVHGLARGYASRRPRQFYRRGADPVANVVGGAPGGRRRNRLRREAREEAATSFATLDRLRQLRRRAGASGVMPHYALADKLRDLGHHEDADWVQGLHERGVPHGVGRTVKWAWPAAGEAMRNKNPREMRPAQSRSRAQPNRPPEEHRKESRQPRPYVAEWINPVPPRNQKAFLVPRLKGLFAYRAKGDPAEETRAAEARGEGGRREHVLNPRRERRLGPGPQERAEMPKGEDLGERLVHPNSACPGCGARHTHNLILGEDEDGDIQNVTCARCGTTYEALF